MLQVAVFATVLIFLSVALYHTVEAPLIAVGVSVSEKFKRRRYTFAPKNHSAEGAI